jgi:hypothetical protein
MYRRLACGSHLIASLARTPKFRSISEISEIIRRTAAGVPTGAEGAAVCASTEGTVVSDDALRTQIPR